MGGHKKKQVVGYRYSLGMHMVLCHGPIDKITYIFCDDKVAWSGESTGGQITIDAEQLFGGEDKEGGVSGIVDIDMGESSQLQNQYLLSKVSPDVPAYRGVLSAILNQCYVGMSAYIKTWKFRGTRTKVFTDGSPQWNLQYSTIGEDINPVNIIYECLTSDVWGLGYLSIDIDEASFFDAAKTLYDEGMGMSLIWDRQISIEEFLSTITRHIDGSLFVDKITGRFRLSLVRDDYVVEDLIVLDETHIMEVSSLSRPIISELTNSVTVMYWDRSTGKDSSITAQDVALQQLQHQVVSTTVQYPGFCVGELAARAASRDLQALSVPLVSCEIVCTRIAQPLSIGDPFIFTWPDFGLSEEVMRVTQISFGSPKSNKIKITAMQDVFSASNPTAVYTGGSDWSPTDVVTDPTSVEYQVGFSLGYLDAYNAGGTSLITDLGSSAALGVCAVSPSSDALSGALWTIDGTGEYVRRSDVSYIPVAVASSSIGYLDETISIQDGIDLDLAIVGSYIMVDDELMRLDSGTLSEITVGRGVLDTVPALHASGSAIMFIGQNISTDEIEYAANESVNYKITARNLLGETNVANEDVHSVVLQPRIERPYPPENFLIDGEYRPESINVNIDLTISWAHRNRLTQLTEYLHDTTEGSIGPEQGVTYSVEVFDNDSSTLLLSQYDIDDDHYSFDHDLLSALYPYDMVRIEVKSLRDGLVCWQTLTHSVQVSFTNPSAEPLADDRLFFISAPEYYFKKNDPDNVYENVYRGAIVAYATDDSETDILYSEYYSLIRRQESSFTHRGDITHSPTAIVGARVWMTDTTISMLNVQGYANIKIGSILAIGEELLRVDSVTTSTVVVGRGILDTAAGEHFAGERLFFLGNWDDGTVFFDHTYYTTGLASIKTIPVNASGPTRTLNASPESRSPVVNRRHSSSPGAYVKVNGMYNPIGISIYDDITVTWNDRAPLEQDWQPDFVDTYEEVDIGPVPDTQYTLTVHAWLYFDDKFMDVWGSKTIPLTIIEKSSSGNSLTFNISESPGIITHYYELGNPIYTGYQVQVNPCVVMIMLEPTRGVSNLSGIPIPCGYQKQTFPLLLLQSPSGTVINDGGRPNMLEYGLSVDTGSINFDPEGIRQTLNVANQPAGGYIVHSETVPTAVCSRMYLVMRFMSTYLCPGEDYTETANYYFRKNGAVLESGVITNEDTESGQIKYTQYDIDIDVNSIDPADEYDIVFEGLSGLDWTVTPYFCFVYYD